MEYAYAHTGEELASGGVAAAADAAEHAHDSLLGLAAHVVEHSLADTLYLLPFLFVTYLAMEWLEHKTGAKTQEAIRRAGAAGPALGAFLGAVPQCGFSAAAATLYAGRVVTLGALFAVFLSTSDEMLPVFLAEQVPISVIAKILGAKILIGMIMGFAVDAVMRLARRGRPADNLRIHELCVRDGCACGHDCVTCENNPESVYSHHDDAMHHAECSVSICGHDHDHDHHRGHGDGGERSHVCENTVERHGCHDFVCDDGRCKGHNHDHSHDHSHGVGAMAKSALVHTVHVAVFILVITIALNAALELVGEGALASFLAANPALSVVASALVGLIPNCAASVVVAQLYVEGVLGAGAMLAGLLVSAGVGLLVLLRANRPAKQNLFIIVALFAMGVFWGLVVHLLGIVF